MLHRVPNVAERVRAFFDLEREKFFLQLLHRTIEYGAARRLRVAARQLQHPGLGRAAFAERVHHELAAMRESAFRVELAVAARLDAQSQERTQQIARDKARASRDHLAVVNEPALGQRVLDSPGHPNRVVVLDMLRHHGFASSRNRLAQARHAEAGGESGAEADLADKFERAFFASHPARRYPPKVKIAMTLERVENS